MNMRPAAKKVLPLDALPVVPAKQGMGGASGSHSRSAVIEFMELKKAVLENAGSVRVAVHRTGDVTCACSVDYKTRDGTAHSPSDYMQAEGTLHFAPNEIDKIISVSIV